MIQQEVQIITTILMALDGLCVIVAGYAAYYLRQMQGDRLWSMDSAVFIVSVFIVMAVTNYTMGKFRLYSDKRPSGYFVLYTAIGKSLLFSFSALILAIFLFQQKDYSRLFLIYFAGGSFLFIALVRTLAQLFFGKYAGKRFNRHRILLVGDKNISQYVAELLSTQISWGHEIIGRLSVSPAKIDTPEVLGCIGDLPHVIKSHTVDEVVFAIRGHRELDLSPSIEACKKMGVYIRILPSLYTEESGRFLVDTCQGVPFLTIGTNNFNATGLLYKRILDVTGGILGSLLLVFIYPFVAVAIKLDSPGKVIFKQQRVGKNGRIFNLYKFRSMHIDAENKLGELDSHNEMGGAMFKIKNDPRVTRVGRWLRRMSIDEFPQFFNVLKGEMSLVGTRPPTRQELKMYKDEHLKRISFKPGITGLWQISGRNKITDFEKVVHLDCTYMENWRFLDDLKILAKTLWVVMQRKGAF